EYYVHPSLSSSPNVVQAVHYAARELVGAYAIAVIAMDEPSRMVVARMGAPLLLGLGDGENFAASDTAALLQVTRRMIHLEEGDCAEVRQKSVTIVDARGHVVERPLHVSQLAADAIELGAYRHYMQKEIFEQPAAIAATLEGVANAASIQPGVFGAAAGEIFSQVDSCLVLARGTG